MRAAKCSRDPLDGLIAEADLKCLVRAVSCLQVFCGMLARMQQYADIVADSKAAEAKGGPRHQVQPVPLLKPLSSNATESYKRGQATKSIPILSWYNNQSKPLLATLLISKTITDNRVCVSKEAAWAQ